MKQLKAFIVVLGKTLNPKYYLEFAEKNISQSWRFFFSLIFISLILMFILFIPKYLVTKSNIEKAFLDVNEFYIETSFKTLKPISFPSENPFITFDTTNVKLMDTEFLLVKDKELQYNFLGRKGQFKFEGFDFVKNRENSLKLVTILFLLFLPGLFLFFYIAYVIKYILIIIPFSGIAYVFSKMMKSEVSFHRVVILSLYTSSIMILLEILTVPLFIGKFLIAYSIFGINYSLVALTMFLILSVTAVRINGSTKLRQDL